MNDGRRARSIANAVDLRNRLWTLLVKRCKEHLWRAGAWLFGNDVEDYVPSLLSRKPSQAAEPEPEQPATPAPAANA